MAKGCGAMTDQPSEKDKDLKCPDCHAKLKERRGRRTDKCELVCGGCGRAFDICDLDTLEALKGQSDP
jgi:DNA-directed RNA polymerase subunit RPC12/RpoP